MLELAVSHVRLDCGNLCKCEIQGWEWRLGELWALFCWAERSPSEHESQGWSGLFWTRQQYLLAIVWPGEGVGQAELSSSNHGCVQVSDGFQDELD